MMELTVLKVRPAHAVRHWHRSEVSL